MMRAYTETIRRVAERLFQRGEIDVFLGFRKGSVPMMNQPFLVRDPADVDLLHWDSHCGLNLCNYLTKRKERIGIVANGCTSRSVVTHVVENQIQREQLYIVGIPCSGMIDHRAVWRAVDGKEIRDAEEAEDTFTVKVKGCSVTFRKGEFLQRNCVLCTHRNPVLYDEMIGEPLPELRDVDPYHDVDSIDSKSPENKWAFFSRLVSKCIRCYACRNACPLCYCPTCFIDESRPQWVGKSTDPTDTMTFHILRAYHCAGRCTDCGACERACPMGIPVRQFTKKLNKDAFELFSWEAGLSLEERPPLDTYKPDDYNEFIR